MQFIFSSSLILNLLTALSIDNIMDIKMKSFCKRALFLYLITIQIYNVRGNLGDCLEEFRQTTCAYDFFCLRTFQPQGDMFYYYRYGARQDFENKYGINRNACRLIDRNGYFYYPIILTYKKGESMVSQNDGDDSIPPTRKSNMLGLIISINLSNNDYKNIPNIKRMENLAVIKISENSLTVAKLSNKNELPSLSEIYLSHNSISEIKYDKVMEHVYTNLTKIDLSYNNLTKISDEVFDPFDELENLDISNNYIDSLSPLTFEGTKKLLYLNISNNRISDVSTSLFRFHLLKFLDLSSNKIKNIKANDLNGLENLETLYLNYNSISVIEKYTFGNMSHMKNLYLNNNELENIDQETFSNVSHLEHIDISSNRIKILSTGLFNNKSIRFFSISDNSLEGSLVKGTFEGLSFVTDLDLSNQRFVSVDDYAFYGLNSIIELLLNNNNIRSLSAKCFKTIKTLEILDLSMNNIENIDFDKDDLLNVISLSLKKNLLTVLKQENFNGLHNLEFLDLSNNKIAQIGTNSFKTLNELISFEVSYNPLSPTLEESSFEGLNSLPSLDISFSSVSTVKNGSFMGMIQLQNLNISHSKIRTLEYNIFVNTGAIKSIDLSFNELTEFHINNTELKKLNTLYLNNNHIKVLDLSIFQHNLRLKNLHLSYNLIEKVNNDFNDMMKLRVLDISYNTNLTLTDAFLIKTKNVNMLNLSGIKTHFSFNNIEGLSLSHLSISNSSICNVKTLLLNQLQHLDTLNLSYNCISKVEVGVFNNISTLRNLDISYNNILYIQPGVFRDNVMLQTLNMSHNFLTAVSYGIFRGLTYLHTLDVSYNNINDLQNERFYEVSSLNILIADHNNIGSINVEEFQGTSLTHLSIGDNPIPCNVLVNFKRHGSPFVLTAIRLNYNDDNFEGITCDKKTNSPEEKNSIETSTTTANAKLFSKIDDVLLNHFNKLKNSTLSNLDVSNRILNATILANAKNDETNKLLNKITVTNNETNILLNKILNVLMSNSATTSPQIQTTKYDTYKKLLIYTNKIKEELEETVKGEKTYEVEANVSKISESHTSISPEMHDKTTTSAESKSHFTEICVGLILILLISFVLLKIYKRRKFVTQRYSVSTRELPDAMDTTL